MAHIEISLTDIKVIGDASCLGGKHPDPPLDNFPLLAWMVSHRDHGDKVFTEDGSASVEAIARDLPTQPNYARLAIKHRTTIDHVQQAVNYAIAAGFLGRQ